MPGEPVNDALLWLIGISVTIGLKYIKPRLFIGLKYRMENGRRWLWESAPHDCGESVMRSISG